MPNISDVDQAAFQQMLANDPEIQAVIRRVWGDTPANQRPSDTPKHLEKANHAASQEIGRILQSRGVQLPKHTFINPRSASLEGERGWAGLPTGVKIALMAAAGATGVGAAGALGAFGAGGAAGAGGAGGAAAAGGAIPSIGATGGLAAGAFPTIAGTAGAGMAGTAAASGGGLLSGLLGKAGTLGEIGQIAGKAAGGAQASRQAEGQALLQQDALKNSQYNTAQNAQMQAGQLDLQRKGFTEDARGGRAKQALIASILGGGFQPTQVSVPGIKNAEISGGLAASLKNPGALQAMQELQKQALAAQLGGDTFSGGQILQQPGVSPQPKAGMLEKILGGVGVGGSLLGALGGRR